LKFRLARRSDVPQLVALLADDPLGQAREGADLTPYLAAFDEIAAAPGQDLIVGEQDGRVIATAQISILCGLSGQGARRAVIEAVRVAAPSRSLGIGALLLAECEAHARHAGATTIQLVTHNSRTRAHAFYEKLGYAPSHLGFKKSLI
jgi:GNAT superfamily N-acetyltransferase